MAAPRKRILSDIRSMPARKVPTPSNKQHETRGLHGQHLLKTPQKHEVHRHQDRDPVRDLRPDQLEPRLTIGRVRPCRSDANKPHRDRQELPIAVDRVAGEIAVGHAENGQPQRNHIRQVPHQGGHRKEELAPGSPARSASSAPGLESHLGRSSSVQLRWSAKMFTRRRLQVYPNNATASDLALRKSWPPIKSTARLVA